MMTVLLWACYAMLPSHIRKAEAGVRSPENSSTTFKRAVKSSWGIRHSSVETPCLWLNLKPGGRSWWAWIWRRCIPFCRAWTVHGSAFVWADDLVLPDRKEQSSRGARGDAPGLRGLGISVLSLWKSVPFTKPLASDLYIKAAPNQHIYRESRKAASTQKTFHPCGDELHTLNRGGGLRLRSVVSLTSTTM